ncbi:EVE domain-containing protein [Dehalococcoidales bacterium]|nr:EVE domain-containing protein [Dehalococcoidales bacterium]
MANWIVVISEDNLARALEHQLIGVPMSAGRTLSKMKKGDRVVFYISKKRQGQGGPGASVSEFGPIAEIADEAPTFDEQPIWYSKSGEKFPWRRKIKVLSTKRAKAKGLVNSLSFIKQAENWGAYFLNTLREIPDSDYNLILKAVES